ncbi:hypothetical protein PUN28_001433 [Cardiocondyla obscurior]|uniref:Uncharacterized protein n=1 Tax=Cardiocondyla obscurior TaxID=286306 RepID=A0AAW2H5E8_9HYME
MDRARMALRRCPEMHCKHLAEILSSRVFHFCLSFSSPVRAAVERQSLRNFRRGARLELQMTFDGKRCYGLETSYLSASGILSLLLLHVSRYRPGDLNSFGAGTAKHISV